MHQSPNSAVHAGLGDIRCALDIYGAHKAALGADDRNPGSQMIDDIGAGEYRPKAVDIPYIPVNHLDVEAIDGGEIGVLAPYHATDLPSFLQQGADQIPADMSCRTSHNRKHRHLLSDFNRRRVRQHAAG